jgi:hypothetical protein
MTCVLVGGLNTGPLVSWTRTLMVVVATFPSKSVEVHCTAVSPIAKTELEDLLQLTLGGVLSWLSVAVGSA